tara:strand:+ start:461 stop:1435 length:975 start_codon:yes stop_codon:yes gene_type:complete
MSKKGEDMKKYFAIAIVAILLMLAYQIISPYLITLLTAFILAYLIKPFFNILDKKLSKPLSASICILLIILILVLPLGFLVNGVANQAADAIKEGKLREIATSISSHQLVEKFNIDLLSFSEKALEYIAHLTATVITALPSLLISLLILIFGIFYFLIGWDELTKNLKKYLPFKDKEKAAKEIKQITNALIYGSVLISLIELIIASIGFYFLGVGMWLVFSILVFFLAFIPGLGPTLVWVPLAIYYFVVGDNITAIGVMVIGLILSYLIDTVLRAKILGKKTGINPFIMLIGIIGGITVFGIFGFIIGPLILFYTIKIIQELIK